MPGRVVIACDESGFVGGSLFGGPRVFAHASVRVDPETAAVLTDEVRRRTGAGEHELKASRLNRPWGRPVAAWLCAAGGPLAGRAFVHLTDTRVFGLGRLAQVLSTDLAPDGWWRADENPAAWRDALRLDRILATVPAPVERDVLRCARDLLWLTRSRRPRASVETWTAVVAAAAGHCSGADRDFLLGWADGEARTRADHYVAEPPAAPLTEPLLPALRWAVHHWSAYGDVDVVHDEQSVLTPVRMAALADELSTTSPGRRLVAVTRVDSRDDVRVQLADLVAGVVRRTFEDRLSRRSSEPALEVDHLVADGSLLLSETVGAADEMDRAARR